MQACAISRTIRVSTPTNSTPRLVPPSPRPMKRTPSPSRGDARWPASVRRSRSRTSDSTTPQTPTSGLISSAAAPVSSSSCLTTATSSIRRTALTSVPTVSFTAACGWNRGLSPRPIALRATPSVCPSALACRSRFASPTFSGTRSSCLRHGSAHLRRRPASTQSAEAPTSLRGSCIPPKRGGWRRSSRGRTPRSPSGSSPCMQTSRTRAMPSLPARAAA